MDTQAALEPACGHIPDQALVDCHDAGIGIGCLRAARPDIAFSGDLHAGPYVAVYLHVAPFFVFAAFASATHDIAADGFYMIALDSGQQSFFVGIRSTFYRLSSIFGQGVLVVVAGVLEEKTGNIPLAWSLTIGLTAVSYTHLTLPTNREV